MAIIGEKLKKYVSDQIKVRQEKLAPDYKKTDGDLVYFNSKTSWIKLASAVEVSKQKLKEIGFTKNEDQEVLQQDGLAKRYILFGGTSNYNSGLLEPKQGIGAEFDRKNLLDPSSYDLSTDFGIVPFPGLKNVSIKCLNRGSLKKAKLKIRVENKFQLQIIDIL